MTGTLKCQEAPKDDRQNLMHMSLRLYSTDYISDTGHLISKMMNTFKRRRQASRMFPHERLPKAILYQKGTVVAPSANLKDQNAI